MKKTGQDPRVIYQKFDPDPIHPRTPGEQALPFIYEPNARTVFLGPPRAYHWQLIKHVPELSSQYENEWDQPAYQSNSNHVHGAMRWPSRQLDFLGSNVPLETKREIARGLKASEPTEEEWNFE